MEVNAIVSLNPGNFNELTTGKTVFIKFFAPWCGHCQSMAADWETLASVWETDEVGLIAEVDCDNNDNDSLCQAAGVQGFPTLKYGDPNELQDYSGGRDYESMAAFASENLKPSCSLTNLELCSDEKKASIAKYQDMSVEELQTIIKDAQSKMKAAEDHMDEEINKLQEAYEVLMKANEDAAKQAKEESNFPLVSAILKSKGGEVPGAETDDMDDDMDDDSDDDDSDVEIEM